MNITNSEELISNERHDRRRINDCVVSRRRVKDQDAFGTFLRNVDAAREKISGSSKMHSGIPLLLSLVKSYVSGEYRKIPCSSIVAAVADQLAREEKRGMFAGIPIIGQWTCIHVQ